MPCLPQRPQTELSTIPVCGDRPWRGATMLPNISSQRNSGGVCVPRALRRPPHCSPRAPAQLHNPAAVCLSATASVASPVASFSFSSLGALLGLTAAPWAINRIRRLFGKRGKRRPAMPSAQVGSGGNNLLLRGRPLVRRAAAEPPLRSVCRQARGQPSRWPLSTCVA